MHWVVKAAMLNYTSQSRRKSAPSVITRAHIKADALQDRLHRSAAAGAATATYRCVPGRNLFDHDIIKWCTKRGGGSPPHGWRRILHATRWCCKWSVKDHYHGRPGCDFRITCGLHWKHPRMAAGSLSCAIEVNYVLQKCNRANKCFKWDYFGLL